MDVQTGAFVSCMLVSHGSCAHLIIHEQVYLATGIRTGSASLHIT